VPARHPGPVITVPHEARHRLEVRFGPGVRAWVDRAPALVEHLARRWRLVLDGTVLHGNSALVLPADRGVLKLHPDEAIAAAEAAALTHWGPAAHVVDLLDHDAGALLLARVRPGDAVGDRPATDPTVLPALRELWATPGVVAGLESATERMAFGLGLVRRRAGSVVERLGADVLDRGEVAALVLAAEPGHRGLVHGDLHGGNLLAGPDGAVVVDPRPCTGDRTSDLVDLALVDPVRLDTTIATLARQLDGLDPDRLHAWCRALAPANAVAALRTAPDAGRTRALIALAVGT
jgi:streptomycin 6-kinase